MEYPLGRYESGYDERDYDLKDFMPKGLLAVSPVFEKSWEYPLESLNQGTDGHCVGFSVANFGISYPTFTTYTNEDGHNFYYMCKEIDGHPKQEGGSTIRTAAKLLKQLGKVEAYAFARTVDNIRWWILNKGPIIAGTIWTEGMCTPDANNIIRAKGKPIGGHAYLLTEWKLNGYIGIQNSWGPNWGKNGKAYISVSDFGRIFIVGGEAMTAVELETRGFPFLSKLFKR